MSDPLGRGLESLIPDKKPDDIPENLDTSREPSGTHPKSAGSPLSNLGTAPAARSYQDHFTPRRSDSIFWIEIEKIEPNPYQPRREFDESALKDLASSIREHGVLQPILVTKREIETPTGMDVLYQLIAGERRPRAGSRGRPPRTPRPVQ